MAVVNLSCSRTRIIHSSCAWQVCDDKTQLGSFRRSAHAPGEDWHYAQPLLATQPTHDTDHMVSYAQQDIGSGNTVVHNTMCFDHPQKSVLYGPWKCYPQPPFWFERHRQAEAVASATVNFQANPTLANFLRITRQARRG